MCIVHLMQITNIDTHMNVFVFMSETILCVCVCNCLIEGCVSVCNYWSTAHCLEMQWTGSYCTSHGMYS